MECEEVFKCGSLYVPPQGFLKQKKSWQRRFYVLYKASRQGIQRLEVFDSEDHFLKQNKCVRIIPLTDCLKVSPSPQKQQSNVFEIRTKENLHLFSADTFQEMTEWLNCLQLVAFSNYTNGNSSAIPNSPPDSNANYFNNNTKNALHNINTVNNLSDTQSEENLLYSSVDAPDIYRIKLVDSDASIRCGLKSNNEYYYTLIITSISISLAEDGKILFTWPFRHIRRYGCTKDGFSLEAGRKCASGDGLFSFITKDGNAIFQAVATHVNSLKASRNLTDDAVHNIGFNSNSQFGKNNETLPDQSHSYFNNETRPLPPPSSSPPISSGISRSGYLPSAHLPLTQAPTRPPELTKRHSIQPPKSPQMIPKTALTRVTSVSTTTTTTTTNTLVNNISNSSSDLKHKPSPPINKPPRKSKESKSAETSDEPLFGTREEMLGLPPEVNQYETTGTYREIKDDEILYDEPGELMSNVGSNINDEPVNSKSPFCPSPPPVNQTVSKLTSVLKMMFTSNQSNQVNVKYSKDKRHVSARSSSTSSANSSSPIANNLDNNKTNSSDDLSYAQVCLTDVTNQTQTIKDIKANKETTHYSKIVDTKADSKSQFYIENEYANIESNKELNNTGKFGSTSSSEESASQQPQHYVQNECEYARVIKRTNNVTKF